MSPMLPAVKWSKTNTEFKGQYFGSNVYYTLFSLNPTTKSSKTVFKWFNRDPNMNDQTKDMRIEDRLGAPPAGSTIPESLALAAQWLKDNQSTSTMPVSSTPSSATKKVSSKLPWIIGGIAVVAAFGIFIWWKRRK